MYGIHSEKLYWTEVRNDYGTLLTRNLHTLDEIEDLMTQTPATWSVTFENWK